MAAKWVVLFLLILGENLFLDVSKAEELAQPFPVPKYVCEPVKDYDWGMCLTSLQGDETPLGDRIPLVLTHGWNSKEIPGEPDMTVWRGLTRHLFRSYWFRERYKLYFAFYLSNIQSIRELGLSLGSLVNQMDQADSDFRSKPLVIIGYSMGGLVARSYMQEPRFGSAGLGGERVLRLITLGTPHHGTPIANGPARDQLAGPLAPFLHQFIDGGLFGFDIRWHTDNRFDLHWDNYDDLLDYGNFPENNLWLERLNSGDTFKRKIIAYAGTVKPFTQIDDCVFSGFQDAGCLAWIMKYSLDISESDGVVPLASALFYPCDDCLGARIYPGYDHSEIIKGELNDWFPFPITNDNDPLFWDISSNLLSLIMPRSTGLDGYVDLGSPDDERFHNLNGWNKINSGLLPRPDTDRNSRYQTLRGQSSMDLFVAEPMISYRLTFRSEAGYCDDSFEVYLNGYLVHKYTHDKKPDFPIHSVDIPAKFFGSSNVRVVFKNLAKDNCGMAAIYYVRLDRI